MFGKNPVSSKAPPNAANFENLHVFSDDDDDDDALLLENQPTNSAPAPAPANVQQGKKRKKPDSGAKPLHAEVVILDASGRKWSCKHCNNVYVSSYTRIYNHLLGLSPTQAAGTKLGIGRCKEMTANGGLKLAELKSRLVAAENLGVSSQLKNSLVTKQPTVVASSQIRESFGIMERDAVDQSLMRFLCANGIAFNVLRSPQFKDFVSAMSRAPKGYKAPSYEKARTTLLDDCKRSVQRQLSPIQDTWRTQGISIVSDGWTNVKNQPLINVIAENSRGATFMYGTDFSGVEKTGEAIAEFLIKSIDEIGPSNVVQVVTDNAANCKKAGQEIQKTHKHIFWSPCVVHTLNLVFKDFGKSFDWLKGTYKKGKEIVKFIVNHQHTLALFRSDSSLELLKVAKTRFATHYILLKRLVDCREALGTLVHRQKWRDWVDNHPDSSTKIAGNAVADMINNKDFWIDVGHCITVLTPLYKVLRFADGEGIKMGEIYERMDNMLGELKDVTPEKYSSDFATMEKIVLSRWEKMNIPLHCLAYALTPRFYDPKYLQSTAPGGLKRKPPNMDQEVVAGVLESFNKITENTEECGVLMKQFANFHMREGRLFSTQQAQADAATMDSITWWSSYGAQTPDLAEVAIKILSQPIGSSSAERSWSTYKYIHSVARNKLHCSRAEKLVFIHSNLRLVSRFSKEYKSGDMKKWDVEPDNPTLEDSTVRLEEMTWRNLEPQQGE